MQSILLLILPSINHPLFTREEDATRKKMNGGRLIAFTKQRAAASTCHVGRIIYFENHDLEADDIKVYFP